MLSLAECRESERSACSCMASLPLLLRSLFSGAAEDSNLSEASSGNGSKWVVSAGCTFPIAYLINDLRKYWVVLQNSFGGENKTHTIMVISWKLFMLFWCAGQRDWYPQPQEPIGHGTWETCLLVLVRQCTWGWANTGLFSKAERYCRVATFTVSFIPGFFRKCYSWEN